MLHAAPNLTNDCQLLRQMEGGDQSAFNILFEKYWERAYNETYRRTKDREAAKDIVQEIFTHIWVNREVLHLENLSAYLHVAIRNRVIRYLQHQQPTHPFFDLLDNLSEAGNSPDARLLTREFFDAYEALLNTLPPQRQLIFRMRYQEDLPTNEISAQLQVSRKTVQNQIGRALQTLKESLLHLFALICFLGNF